MKRCSSTRQIDTCVVLIFTMLRDIAYDLRGDNDCTGLIVNTPSEVRTSHRGVRFSLEVMNSLCSECNCLMEGPSVLEVTCG